MRPECVEDKMESGEMNTIQVTNADNLRSTTSPALEGADTVLSKITKTYFVKSD